jgi:hypothetical protein
MDKSAKRFTGLALACLAISLAWTLIGPEEGSAPSSPQPERTISSAAVTVPATAVTSNGRSLVRDLARFSPQLYRIMQATEQAHAEVEQLQRKNQESPPVSL